MNWKIYVLVSVLFFVTGQVFLKYDSNVNPIISLCFFTIMMGLLGLVYLIRHSNEIDKEKIPYFSLIAGFVFFFGNMFWIRSIQKSPSLSNVRILMAGGETISLLLTGLLFFKQKITLKQVIGTIIILFGIRLI